MKKRNLIFMLIIILAFIGCKKKYTFTENWKFNTKKETAQLRFQYKDNVYVTAGEYLNENSPNHLIYCLDLKTGSVKWKFDLGAGIYLHKIKLFKGKIFLMSYDDKVTRLDALTGKKLKKITVSNIPETVRNHTFNGNKIVAVAGDEAAKKASKIVCKNADGKILWSYAVKTLLNIKEPYHVNFSFLMNGENLILATYDGKVKSLAIK
jgi:outer membrane protein assembly factor BamB